MRCRAVAHLRAVGCRSLAVVAALFTVMAVMFAPQAMAADGSADYDTWADVAAAMDKQLQQGQTFYVMLLRQNICVYHRLMTLEKELLLLKLLHMLGIWQKKYLEPRNGMIK